MYALIEFAGKQFKVEEGDTIKVPFIDGKVGSKVTIDKVLYFDDGKIKTVGKPVIKDFSIDCKIESSGRERKVVVFKFKRRKGYQKKNTHRQEFSMIKVGKLSKKSIKAKASTSKDKPSTAKKATNTKTKTTVAKKIATPKKKALIVKKVADKKQKAKKG